MSAKRKSEQAYIYSTCEVIAATGVSERNLQWWDERQYIVPAHDGHRRRYSLLDVVQVVVTSEFRKRGIPLQKSRKLWARISSAVEAILNSGSRTPLWLVIDSRYSIRLESDMSATLRCGVQAKGPVWVLSLSQCVEKALTINKKQKAAVA